MKTIFDTSVLVASFVQHHPKHLVSLKWLKRVKERKNQLFVAGHSILEIYSVLTRAPFKPKILPVTAKRIIDINLRHSAKIISLNATQ